MPHDKKVLTSHVWGGYTLHIRDNRTSSVAKSMKMFPLIAVFCASLLFASVSAQEPSAEQSQREIEDRLRILLSPVRQLDELSEKLAAFRAPWEGNGTVATLRMAMRLIGADELGLSEEQKERLPFTADGDGMKQAPYEDFYNSPSPAPELVEARMALKTALIPDDPFLEHASEEQKYAFVEAAAKIDGLFQKTLRVTIEEILTPEQMREVRKLEIQLMAELGVPFPSMFEIFDLTDEQKKEMDEIIGEMKPQYDRLVLEFLTLESEIEYAQMRSEIKGKTFASLEELHKSFGEIRSRYAMANPDGNKRSREFYERGTKFATLLQDRMMNVLTDEQLDRMQVVLDETPNSIKRFLAGVKAMRELQKMLPAYAPGPDSWRPGMPLPVLFKEERRTGNFPRSE